MPHRWADDCSLVRQFWISQCPMYPARRAECPARSREASPRQMWASALRWSCWCAKEAAWRRWSVTWADRVVIDCADIAVPRGRSVRCYPGSPPRAARVNRTLVVCLQRGARFKHQLVIYNKGIYIYYLKNELCIILTHSLCLLLLWLFKYSKCKNIWKLFLAKLRSQFPVPVFHSPIWVTQS